MRYILAALALLLAGCNEMIPANAGAAVLRAESPSFFAFGDWGANSDGQRKVAEAVHGFCEKSGCDFGLLLGDNFYPGGVKSIIDPMWKSHFLDIYEKLTMPLYVSLGNHDYGGSIEAQTQYKDPKGRWTLPTRYYQFTAGDAAFFALDTTRWTPAQALWLDKALDAAGDVKWKVVFGHHPIYSYGASHGDTPYLVKELLPILKRRHVQLYLAGHDHDRQVLRDSPEGPLCIQSGGGGAELRPVKKGPRSLFAVEKFGAAYVSLLAGAAKVQMFDTDGKVDYEMMLEGAPKAAVDDGGEESARNHAKKSKIQKRQ